MITKPGHGKHILIRPGDGNISKNIIPAYFDYTYMLMLFSNIDIETKVNYRSGNIIINSSTLNKDVVTATTILLM